jgi:hypothetical protein
MVHGAEGNGVTQRDPDLNAGEELAAAEAQQGSARAQWQLVLGMSAAGGKAASGGLSGELQRVGSLWGGKAAVAGAGSTGGFGSSLSQVLGRLPTPCRPTRMLFDAGSWPPPWLTWVPALAIFGDH